MVKAVLKMRRIRRQLPLFDEGSAPKPEDIHLNYAAFDRVCVLVSGGKDSVACLLHLLEQPGLDRSKLEIHHHLVDGNEGSGLMDWPCTGAYVRKLGEALGIPTFFSWRVHGFEGELLKENSRSHGIRFEDGDRVVRDWEAGGKPRTRRKFPQTSADLRVRWCSGHLKIDVFAVVIRNDLRFRDSRTLVVTGERAEESKNRSRYEMFERHRADARKGLNRFVDHYRPLKWWSEEEVWKIIERHRVNPHPAYKLGWGRVSCASCIFGSPNQWASIRAIDPERFSRISELEREFELTIHRERSVDEQADRGQAYELDPHEVSVALRSHYNEPILLPEGAWTLPRGAYGDSSGPS